MNEERVNTLMEEICSFKKEFYYREELMAEMFNLQREMVNLTFGEKEGISNRKIWDIENYFREQNEELGNPFSNEIQEFEEDSKKFCTTLKGLCLGDKGERLTQNALERVTGNKVILKNIELYEGNHRTEIDALVLTPGIISIIEVKNTTKNIFIDEDGNYYRVGTYNRLDCNILKKVKLKEAMIKEILKKMALHV